MDIKINTLENIKGGPKGLLLQPHPFSTNE